MAGSAGEEEASSNYAMNATPQDNPSIAEEEFRAARRRRKRSNKWWRQHIPLAYVVSIAIVGAFYFTFSFIFGNGRGWLTKIGVTPSGVNLIFGTTYCAIGIWGLMRATKSGVGWIFIFSLCVLGGILQLFKAFAFL
jgi:hypothetical protein